MHLRQMAAPEASPVWLEAAKVHLRVEDTAENATIQDCIDSAVGHIDGPDGWLNRCLITQAWAVDLDGWWGLDCYGVWRPRLLQLPLAPVSAISAVRYIDQSGVTQTLDPSNYHVFTGRDPGVQLITGFSRPALACHDRTVSIEFVAGYGDAWTDVPAQIRRALLLMTGDLYANRETVVSGDRAASAEIVMTTTVESLLMPFRYYPS